MRRDIGNPVRMDIAALGDLSGIHAVTERPQTFGQKLRVVVDGSMSAVLGHFTEAVPRELGSEVYDWLSVEEMVDRMRL